MQTSASGIADLKSEEGVVLRAYRDVVGVWTIGCGLTAASGVVKPKAGMVITEVEADRLLKAALARNYEPTVEVAMAHVAESKVTRPKQHEFDAGVSFHFNTGAIKKAGWVKKWVAGASAHDVRSSLLQWAKGGGKVLPGLVARRGREADMLLNGVYRNAPKPAAPRAGYAVWALDLTSVEKLEVIHAFERLGYDHGPFNNAIMEGAVRLFQRDHGLTIDGIIGRATLSTLQRRLDAPKAAAKPATAMAAPAAALSMPDVGQAVNDGLGITGAEWLALGLIGLWGLSVAWRYRDVVAAKLQPVSPRLATFLRSF